MMDGSANGPSLDYSVLGLTQEEKNVFGRLFKEAEAIESSGVITGDVAVKFFERANLDRDILGRIWQIADMENRGYLTPQGFCIVLRLIGHAQNGREPVPDLAYKRMYLIGVPF
jgi:epidermal growth factor receptor substrate 15